MKLKYMFNECLGKSDEKLLILTSLIFPSENHFRQSIPSQYQKPQSSSKILRCASYSSFFSWSDLAIKRSVPHDLKVRNFWDTSLTAFPMGLPKVHVSGKNPSSGNSWKHSLALYTPASTQATTDVDTSLSGYYIRSGPFLESSCKFSRPESCFVCAFFFLMHSRSKFQ